MLILALFFLSSALVIWWCYAGYMYYLLLYNLFRRFHSGPPGPGEVLPVCVIVPVLDEAELIEAKLRNLVEQEYPAGLLEAIVADGGSSDGTRDLVLRFQESHPDFKLRLLICPQRGRSRQINHALENVDTPLVAVSDADAILAPGCLLEIAHEFARSERTGVVGALVNPDNCVTMEKTYWSFQNLLRCLESRIESTSIVAGPCYAFRRSLVWRLPDDCSADDVHVCLLANNLGFQAKYLESARAVETRGPTSTLEFLNHKFRKTNGYLVELLRFLYRFPTYRFQWKIVFATRLLQIIVVPFLLPQFAAMALNISLVSVNHAIGIGAVAVFLGLNVLVVSRLLRFEIKRRFGMKPGGGMIRSFIFGNTVLFFAVLCYLFHFQSDQPEKVGKATPPAVRTYGAIVHRERG